jgi:endonuclease YncB( thermonuclease family)
MRGTRGLSLIGSFAALAVTGSACGTDRHDDVAAGLDTVCTVRRVVDGDTIDCTSGIKIRLVGIDAPEGDQRPWGDRSRAALRRLVPEGRTVRIERDREFVDRFGRTLAYLWDADHMVNESMIRGGWAVTFFIPPNTRYRRRLRAAERAARDADAGLWADWGFTCRPVDHRARRC